VEFVTVKIRKVLWGFRFVLCNLLLSKKLNNVNTVTDDGFEIRGMRSEDIFHIKQLVLRLNNGIGFEFFKRLLYRIVGSKMVFVVKKVGAAEIVAVNLFYFNDRDRCDNTIHEGFIGVLPSCRGLGVASKLRRCAIANFERTQLSGISTRISISNAPSFRSAEKMGFRVVDRYFDANESEERCYLVRYFK
jgi:GNAT superfamily N-acetyltransferase